MAQDSVARKVRNHQLVTRSQLSAFLPLVRVKNETPRCATVQVQGKNRAGEHPTSSPYRRPLANKFPCITLTTEHVKIHRLRPGRLACELTTVMLSANALIGNYFIIFFPASRGPCPSQARDYRFPHVHLSFRHLFRRVLQSHGYLERHGLTSPVIQMLTSRWLQSTTQLAYCTSSVVSASTWCTFSTDGPTQCPAFPDPCSA